MYRTVRRLRHSSIVPHRRSLTSNHSVKPTTQSSPRPTPNSGPTAPPVTDRGPITWKTFALFTGIGTAALAYYSIEKQRRMEEITKPRVLGRAAIGGPFELIDGDGKLFTEAELFGKWNLIYFGFTMCPDICPAELTKVAEALDILEKKGRKVSSEPGAMQPVFISVDPERDTPERSTEYARGFHTAFVGLSGSEEQVRQTAKAYRVYYSRDDAEGDEYLVDHSIITYLMDPAGEFREFYAKSSTAVEIAARIEQQMLAWRG